jgi:large conductance mechanosensitive channel
MVNEAPVADIPRPASSFFRAECATLTCTLRAAQPVHQELQRLPGAEVPMAFADDFKKFAFKGNVADLAVGVIIGAAFGKIVAKLVEDLVMPLIGLALPGGDWRTAGITLRHAADPKDNVLLRTGDFLGALLDFFVVALVLFILMTKLVAAAQKRLAKPEAAAAPTTKECPFCLEAIPLLATRCRACTSEVR